MRSPDAAQRNPGLFFLVMEQPRISLRCIRATLTSITFTYLSVACGTEPARAPIEPPPQAVSVTPGPVLRDALAGGGNGPELVQLPPGSYVMGDLQGDGLDNEAPQHRETVAAFAIGKFEVTFEEFDRFCAATGRAPPRSGHGGRGRYPVAMVDWFDAVDYTDWLSAQTGRRYRLPTEAEWEYAARAGTTTNYWWGNRYEPDRASCYDCGVASKAVGALPVGTFAPNPFGLHDTVGNMWEWTASRWNDRYNGDERRALRRDEVQVTADYLKGIQIAMRGGSWNLHPHDSRVSSRYYGAPQSKTFNLGFRVARDL